ncbi:hypothetical protein KAZ01_03950 [Candidatus Gracilibacteria bacterium]|nr:hypothetical protein [Candidatus Gracilibacteria bacterium]
MQLYKHYYKIHENTKMIIFMDKEITSEKNIQFLLEDLMVLNSIKVEYIIKPGIENDINLTNEDLDGTKKKKMIYFNKKGLLENNGSRVNSIDVVSLGYEEKINKILSNNDNETVKHFLSEAKKLILNGKIDRAHIIPFKSKNLLYELLSIDGVGTIIGSKFGEPEIKGIDSKDIPVVKSLLDANIKKGFLKPRNENYLQANYKNFYIAYVDQIPVGCVEIIPINENTVELGALSVIENFLCYKIGVRLTQFVEFYAKNNKKIVISVTNNPKLEKIYLSNGYSLDTEGKYSFRSENHPEKNCI